MSGSVLRNILINTQNILYDIYIYVSIYYIWLLASTNAKCGIRKTFDTLRTLTTP